MLLLLLDCRDTYSPISSFPCSVAHFNFIFHLEYISNLVLRSKSCRSWQGSNLRGQSPLDFKSNALTTRPQLPRWIPALNTGQKEWRCGGSNPGPFTCKANALPLSYIPSVMNYIKSTTKQTRLVFLWWRFVASIYCLRPYHVENTSSRLITEVKQHWAMLVLGWVTAWEYMVL